MSHSYKDLRVWQHGIELVTSIYRVTQKFPKEELYGLTAQMRRSAISVPSNIAEGQGRQSKKDFRHFLAQALGSLLELETQLVIAGKLGYVQDSARDELLNESGTIRGMLNGLMQSLSEPEFAARNAKRET